MKRVALLLLIAAGGVALVQYRASRKFCGSVLPCFGYCGSGPDGSEALRCVLGLPIKPNPNKSFGPQSCEEYAEQCANRDDPKAIAAYRALAEKAALQRLRG